MMTLLMALVLAQDADALLEKLKSDDVAVRDEAQSKLIAAGPKALPKVKEALAAAKDADLRARLEKIAAEIDRIERGDKLKIEIEPAKEPPTLAQARSSRRLFTIRITNETDKDVVLWSYVRLEVFDADGKPVKSSAAIGRWGLREKECFLECQPFETLAARGTKEIVTGLASYEHDPGIMLGWKLPAAGDYTLKATYVWKRGAVTCPCKREDHDDAKHVWNTALEVEKTAQAKLTVK